MHGLDKSALAIGGHPIIERQLAVLRALTQDLLIVANDATRFAATGVRVVPDLVPDAGPLGGLYTALMSTASPYIVIVACDMPFLAVPFLRHLVTRIQDAAIDQDAVVDVAVPRTADGYHPLCAVYGRPLLPRIAERLARRDLEMAGLIREARRIEIGPDELAQFDPDAVLLCNVNTPHDYRQACSRAFNR